MVSHHLDVCGENEIVNYCGNCEQKLQCPGCSKFLHGTKKRQDHLIITYADFLEKNKDFLCSSHQPQLLKLFCHTCKKAVCSTCIESTHLGHEVHTLDDGIKYLKSTLESKKQKVDDKVYALTKTEEMYTTSFNEIDASYKMCKESIIDGFKKLKEAVEKREAELLDEIEKSEGVKLAKSASELQVVKDANQVSIDMKNKFKLVSEQTENKLETLTTLLDMEEQMNKAVDEEVDEFPITDLPLEKYLTIKDTIESIGKITLTSVVDPRKSSITADTSSYAILGSEIKLSIYLKGRYDIINPFQGGQSIKIEVDEKPNGSKPTLSQAFSESRIMVSLKGDYDGTYRVRVTSDGKDIKGSPFEVVFYPEVDDVIEVPDKLTAGGCYHALHKEFWIKTKDKIHGYNLKGVPVRVLDSHMHQFSVDEQGNVYGGDNDKNFMKYDKLYREKWTVYPAEGKNPVTACADATWVYAIYKSGPLLILSKENGNTIQVVEMAGVENVIAMAAYEDHLFLSDNGILKIYTKKGKLVKVFDEFKQIAGVTVINHMIYVCQDKTNKWIRIMTPQHYSVGSSEGRKLIKLPSLFFSPRGIDLDDKNNSQGSISPQSIFFSKLPLSPRNQSFKK